MKDHRHSLTRPTAAAAQCPRLNPSASLFDLAFLMVGIGFYPLSGSEHEHRDDAQDYQWQNGRGLVRPVGQVRAQRGVRRAHQLLRCNAFGRISLDGVGVPGQQDDSLGPAPASLASSLVFFSLVRGANCPVDGLTLGGL